MPPRFSGRHDELEDYALISGREISDTFRALGQTGGLWERLVVDRLEAKQLVGGHSERAARAIGMVPLKVPATQ